MNLALTWLKMNLADLAEYLRSGIYIFPSFAIIPASASVAQHLSDTDNMLNNVHTQKQP